MPLTAACIDAAARRLAPFLDPTPIVASPWLSDATNANVSLKLEIVQPTGSFKVRGALNALLAAIERGDAASSVVTASAGNHGAALAWAGALVGVNVRVYVPATAPRSKRDAIARYGATLIEAPNYDDAEARARADAADMGTPYISPYNHPDVIAGAGTIGRELFQRDRDRPDVVVAPIGGGGLLAGVGLAVRAQSSTCEVIGAEVAASPVFTTSLARGAITTVDVRPTLADGLAGNLEPGSATFDLVRDLASRIVLVDEDALASAMDGLRREERLIAEGASCAAIAALLSSAADVARRNVVVVLTGRNTAR